MTDRRLSPSALNQFLGCEVRTHLDLRHAAGTLEAEPLRPDIQLLLERGQRHEEAVLAELSTGRDVESIPTTGSLEERAEATLLAMRAGRDVIYQACLMDDDWLGFADFLVRVDAPSELGGWSYEVHDVKLGSQPLPRHLLQLLVYDEQVTSIQGLHPQRVHLTLGDRSSHAFRVDDVTAYARRVVDRYLARRDELAGQDPIVAYPYPVEDCDFCPWWKRCANQRRADDHIALVANLHRRQGLRLEEHGVRTVAELAALDDGVRVPRLAPATLTTLRAQAALQLRSRDREVPRYELLAPAAGRGLARLPEPSAGDVFFDFEGDRWWGDDGLEFLFGTVYRDGDGWVYEPRWAESRAEEKQQFESWADWITERLAAYPDLHVFHFNSYEPTKVKELMLRHGTRIVEVDDLLKRHVFVDLYTVIRQGVRIGTESYGLKTIEAAYGYRRPDGQRGAIRPWQEHQANPDPALLSEIAAYNEDDCRSTLALYDWLRDRRTEAEEAYGVRLGSLQPTQGRPPSPKQLTYQAALDRARGQLMTGLPDDARDDDVEQGARRLTFDLAGYHEREDKPALWQLFARQEMTSEELIDDGDAVGGLTPVPGTTREAHKQSWRWTLQFPVQEHKLKAGEFRDPDAGEDGAGVVIESVDHVARTLVVRRAKRLGEAPPTRIIPGFPIQHDDHKAALFRFADRIADHGTDPRGSLDAGTDLLLARAPRFAGGAQPLTAVSPSAGADDLTKLAAQLARSVLMVQGPPGTGKTYTGAQVAVNLMRDHGLRVGVAATSHKAITNFLRDVDAHATRDGFAFCGWKKASSNKHDGDDHHSDTTTSSDKPPADEHPDLIAGTSWLWSKAEWHEAVDVLFIDEAGQVSLADAIAMSQGAESVVLLGDPQQLAHVSQGTHLHGSGASVLEHLLGDRQTVPADRGVLLDCTWRMHPDVSDFVSKTMYDDRLRALPACSRQRVEAEGMTGTGLRMLTVHHVGNRRRSTEEARAIAAEIDKLLHGGTFTDRDGETRELTLDDILVVAPYNAQVSELLAALPEGAHVGTVDKFQGQQAPVVFFSMTSSSADEVPRGMEFLFSRNRLNVAVSRAQALAVVVCSPDLLTARCATVEQMKLVNMLCRFADEAVVTTV